MRCLRQWQSCIDVRSSGAAMGARSIQGLAAVYQWAEFLTKQKAALEAWADHSGGTLELNSSYDWLRIRGR